MQHQADSRYAALRLAITLALMTIGSVGMYVVPVVLPAVQADFGVARADAIAASTDEVAAIVTDMAGFVHDIETI